MGEQVFFPLIVVFSLMLVFVPSVIWASRKFGFVSKVDFRRKYATPLLGGVAVYLATLIGHFFFAMDQLWIVLLSLPIVVVGLLDDIVEFSSKPKFLIQVGSVVGFLYFLPSDQLILSESGLPLALVYLLSAFWAIGVINAVNMIDGMDGESSSFSFIAAVFMATIASEQNFSLSLYIVAAATFGFFLFNKPKAKIYIGDAGSSFLGFFLAAKGLSLPLAQVHTFSFLIPLMIFSFPTMDALLAIARRAKNKTSLFQGDHDHLHHKLQKIGFSVPQALAIIVGVVTYSSFAGWVLSQLDYSQSLFASVLLLSIPSLISVLAWVYFLEFKLGLQTSLFSKNLIHQYLPISQTLENPSGKFRMVVYDLMPYYKELQSKGVRQVHEFIQSFAHYVKESHPKSDSYISGSYTLVVVEDYTFETVKDVKKEKLLVSKNELIEKFKELLLEYSVLKNDTEIPWGMEFYLNQSKAEDLFEKYGLSLEPLKDEVKSSKVS